MTNMNVNVMDVLVLLMKHIHAIARDGTVMSGH